MYDDLLKLIDDFNELYKEEQEKAPFNLCLLDLCGANENAHTKILLQLLKYRVNESYPFFESLLERWFRDLNLEFDCRKLEISFNKDFIDGLIKDDQKAIIIENKIHYAQDQDKQIERYVEKVKEYGIDLENIHVVYLTRYGDKKVSDNSCSFELRRVLGDRFIESNYCYDILPWLKEDVLPNCKWRDDNLVSALKQYIDHLDGMFGQRNSNSMEENLKNWLKEKLGLQYGWTKECYQNLLEMPETMRRINEEIENIKREPHESFKKITTLFWQDYFKEHFKILEDPIIYDRLFGKDPYMIIGLHKWNDNARMIHLEWKMVEEAFFVERDIPLWLHFEGNVSPILDSLKEDGEFKRLIAETGMEFKDSSHYKINISLDKEFAFMDGKKREECLNAIYKKYAPLLKYVYEKCEEVYKND